MMRSVGTALVGTAVLAALAGCVQQKSFGLPELTPPGATSGIQVSPGYGSGYGYDYGNGYPGSYAPGYGYADPYYAGQAPYPYGYYSSPYNPYPRYVVIPCADNNSDGRCDHKPPKDRDHHGNDDQGGGHDRDDRQVPPRYARGATTDAPSNTGHGARREAAPVVQPQPARVIAPAPVVQPPARARQESRRATSPTQDP